MAVGRRRRSGRRMIAVAVAVTSAMAASVALSRRAVRRAEERFPPTGVLVRLDGCAVHVVRLGVPSADRLPLVLIHGADGVAHEFTDTVAEDLAADREVFVVDRPGHGWSTMPADECACVDTNVRLLREALRALGVERAVLVGHSYGASVAMRWALDRPEEVAGLVVVSPAAYWRWRYPRWPLTLTASRFPGVPLTEALLLPVGRAALPLFERRAFAPQPAPSRYRGFARALYLRPGQFSSLVGEYARLREDLEAMQHRYGELSLPVAIVVGDHDRVTPHRKHAEPLSADIAGATLRVLPRIGHELQWHAPAAIVGAVSEVDRRLAGHAGQAR